MLMVVIRSIQLPALTWLLAAIIKGPIDGGNVTGMIWGAVAFLFLALSTQIVMHYRQRLAQEMGELVVYELRNEIFAHLQSLPMSFFNRTKLGRIISRMSSDVEDLRVGIQEVAFVSLVSLGQMAVAAACMLWYDWVLFLMVLGLAPVLWGINQYFRKRMSIALRQLRESFSRVTATLAESVNGIRVTQGFVRQDENGQMFGELVTHHAGYNAVLNRAQGLFLPLLDLNNQFFVAGLLLVGGYQVMRPGAEADIGNLVGFLFMATMFFSPITTLGNQYYQALTAMAAAERVFTLLDTPPDWSEPPTAQPIEFASGRVEFRDLSFGYDPNRLVLRNLNFVAEPGEMVALVGHTGSGKTSIINLISKFYLPTSGGLLFDGVDVREITGASLRSQIGIVLQNNFLFTGTVLDNICLSRPEATEIDVRRALRDLDCLDLVEALPDGLHTQVGERGGSLSLGQRQVICFARAMLADPKILILDEATSSIDTITEARIQRALNLLLAGRTSFVIAHRLSTVRHADRVLVLENGEIVERGTHATLVSAGGHYATLHQRFVEQ